MTGDKFFFAVLLALFIASGSQSMEQASTQKEIHDEMPMQNTRELIEWMQKKGIDMQTVLAQTDNNNYTLLHDAAEQLDVQHAKLLLENFADVNAKGGPKRDTQPIDLVIRSFHADPEKACDMISLLCAYNTQITARIPHQLMLMRMYSRSEPQKAQIITECLRIIRLHEKGQNDGISKIKIPMKKLP